jgi:medium-chain acyl-[acyl-carrier-protein] hydrolase
MTIHSTNWLTCFQSYSCPKIRLFCFPYAGAGASIFHVWSKILPENIELFALKLPGRESRFKEPLLYQLSPLINHLVPALLPYLDIPFVFFGHSFGALVCFELTRQLRQQNLPIPLCLLVSGRRAPQLPRRYPTTYNLSESEFMKEIRNLNGTPESLLQNQDLMKCFLTILRADLAIDETYTYKDEAPLDCHISVFGGFSDYRADFEELSSWKQQTTGNFYLQMFSGDHFFINQEKDAVLKAVLKTLGNLLINNESLDISRR